MPAVTLGLLQHACGDSPAENLRHAVDLVRAAGGRIVHLDLTVVCEAPRVGPHRDAMAKLRHWCDEAGYAHWRQDKDVMPAWDEAVRHMRESGKFSQVLYPSDNHRAGRMSD